jgi:hypothetical protein
MTNGVDRLMSYISPSHDKPIVEASIVGAWDARSPMLWIMLVLAMWCCPR